MKIAIIVHGRFHAFDLARGLLRLGHDVTLFTNYPKFVAARFGIPRDRVRCFRSHGLTSRVAWKLFPGGLDGAIERVFNLAFGRWAARQVLPHGWDAVVSFSGVAEETFRGLADRATLRVLQRGSAHIAVQRRLLFEERARTGLPVEAPSEWIVEREKREYEMSDVIHVLSKFAEDSFVQEGVSSSKLFRLTLGVNTSQFRATDKWVGERRNRVLAGEPLQILNVGTFCCRKGALDWVEVVNRLAGPRFRFRFVGPVAADGRALAARLHSLAAFSGKRPQARLPEEYRGGDVFVLPTLEDGFAVVLNQALAAGIPLITTPNCAGPDLITEGQTGWVVPIRSPQAIVERLEWLDRNREALVRAIDAVRCDSRDLDWQHTAVRAEQNLETALAARRRQTEGAPHAL